jgi:ABC-type Mn2+/Zn2+ transport system permease subunit
LLAVAATVVASSRIVGTLLASALLVLPPATARLVVGSVVPMLAVSTAIGGAVGVTGVVIADLADLPPGPAVTLVATVVFVVGFVRSDLERRRTAAASQEHSALL